MRISTQLLSAFVGITVIALVVFGSVAYWITLDINYDNQRDFLRLSSDRMVGELAAKLSVSGVSEQTLETVRRQLAPSSSLAVVYDSNGTLMAVAGDIPGRETLAASMLARRPDESDGVYQTGRLPERENQGVWLSAPIPETPARLLLAQLDDQAISRFSVTLATRLLSTGMGIVWASIWVALLLSSVIARRLHEKNVALEYQATHDTLTDLPNRALLFDRISRLQHTAHGDGTTFALLLMDLDRFKEINDTLGHHFGDQLLQQVGNRIGQSLREGDTIARLGGDEFALLMPATRQAQPVRCAERVMQQLDDSFLIDNIPVQVKVSIGIAVFPEHGDSAESLLQHADVAMYKAKHSNTGYAIYDPSQDEHSVRRLTLMGELRSAIADRRLTVHYQPKIDLHTGLTTGVEALARWVHPELGFVPPDEFIPLAEQMGAIRDLTDCVFAQAMQESRQWSRRGQSLTVAVNLSTHCLQDSSLPERLAQLMRTVDFPASRLELEITESALMHDLDTARAILNKLNAMGLKLSIDDFGTGFSSLSYLTRLPVDALKIDKSFVIDMHNNEGNAAIVRSVIDMAHHMGLKVVAEGIETQEAVELLAGLGCDLAQGYFISRPLPGDQFETWLASSRSSSADEARASARPRDQAVV
ncbi:MAG: EAL domain-containing protein [Gammaproteobacteria bacterium]|nr:MAG: EAL domain-containing protein [Gammaproteobacteria bacterium]